jgi:hypothetical protein
MFLTQQALSERVRKLEDALSVQLFLRINRAVELTENGELLLSHARHELVRISDVAPAAVGANKQSLRLDVIDNQLSPMFVLRSPSGPRTADRAQRAARTRPGPPIHSRSASPTWPAPTWNSHAI